MAFADTAKLVVDLDLDNAQFVRGAKQSTAATKKFGAEVKKTGQQMSRLQRIQQKAGKSGLFGNILTGVGMGGGLMAFQAAIGLARKGVSIVTDATKAAKAEDAAMEQLTKSLELNAEAWDGDYQAIEDWVAAAQEATAVGDGEIRPALALLVAATEDVTEAQELLAGAMDFSRGVGIDLDY